MLKWLKWVGTATGILGALMLDVNFPYSKWGFVAFLISSMSWLIVGVRTKERSLAIQSVVYTVLNIIGIFRWLI